MDIIKTFNNKLISSYFENRLTTKTKTIKNDVNWASIIVASNPFSTQNKVIKHHTINPIIGKYNFDLYITNLLSLYPWKIHKVIINKTLPMPHAVFNISEETFNHEILKFVGDANGIRAITMIRILGMYVFITS
jgi:hypothetical protein